MIWTNPPSGIGAIWNSVPPRLNPISVGPKPIENRSTRIPHSRATREVPPFMEHDEQTEPNYREEKRDHSSEA